MNRYYKFTTLLLVVALVSCYKDEPMTEPGQQGPSQIKRCLRNGDDVKMIVDPEQLHRITPQRAELIAVNAVSAFSTNANTRTYAVKSVAAVEPILSTTASAVVLSSAGTRAASTTADTLMYAVNFANDEGFALVSFDDRDGDILMYSENGSFDITEIAASDDIMKFHVDMVMAYQQDKLNRIREAEAAGIEYVGEIKMDTVSVEVFDMPTDLTENPYEQVATRAGMPGSGLPGGGGSGGPGMPGMPGRTTIPANYQILGWSGNADVIAAVERQYGRNPRSFGLPVAAPQIDFNPLGVPGVDAPPCPYPPYCDPPIVDYNGYYYHYGAELTARYTNPKYIVTQHGPLLTTYWDQGMPLNRYSGSNHKKEKAYLLEGKGVPAGCNPIAIVQIFAYHEHPKSFRYYNYQDSALRVINNLNYTELKKSITNKDLLLSPYADDLAYLVDRVGQDLETWYTIDGSGSPRFFLTPRKVLNKVFKAHGYKHISLKKNYKKADNFKFIKNDIFANRPILIWGYPPTTKAIDDDLYDSDDIELTKAEVDELTKGYKVSQGHVWVIDGYRTTREKSITRNYRFDQYGNYNYFTELTSLSYAYKEYIHANLGWGYGYKNKYYDIWVLRGVYQFTTEDNFGGKIKFVHDIRPDK